MTSNFKKDGNSAMVAIDSNGGLNVNQEVVLEGVPALESFVHGSDKAKAFSIRMTVPSGSIYSYEIIVDGEGPEGILAGSWYLHFTDDSGDTYTLSLYDHTRKSHTLGFNSDSPRITKIRWSDS